MYGESERNVRIKEKEKIGDCFLEVEWEFGVDWSEVEGYSCQVIIISYKALTSHLTELAVFNLSLK